ncbi:pilus assembly protein TadG-related protein [Mariniblastus sp.]|nr:pilus assembly protein TadG-related protein [Mariniblastus sp.]MDC0283916.1 pilus assembly protein TadG-related protein [Mariniblastus sp.]
MKTIPTNLSNQKRKERRGSVVVTMPVMLGGLIFVAAIMVDIGSFYVNKSQMQNAADAAAIAAAMKIGNDRSATSLETAKAYASDFANKNQVGRGDVLVADDISMGIWDYSGGGFTPGADVNNANSFQITVRRGGAASDGLGSYFSRCFGLNDFEAVAKSTVVMSGASAAVGVPLALRAPGFGAINPNLTQTNPNFDGPCCPDDNVEFAVGDTVVLLATGNNKVTSHLALKFNPNNINSGNHAGNRDYMYKLLDGSVDGVVMRVGDEAAVHDKGTNPRNFRWKLEQRTLLSPDDPKRCIIVPVVELLSDSKNGAGKINKKVRICDFVCVYVWKKMNYQVINPNNSSKKLTQTVILGQIRNRRAATIGGGQTPSGAGGKSVTSAALVN